MHNLENGVVNFDISFFSFINSYMVPISDGAEGTGVGGHVPSRSLRDRLSTTSKCDRKKFGVG